MTTPIKNKAVSAPFLPKIYYLHPHAAGSPSGVDKHIERCAALGFDHVLMPARSLQPQSQSHSALHDESDEAAETIAAAARACAKKKLRLLLDFDINRVAMQDSLAETHSDWFAYRNPDDDLPDPRRPAMLRPATRTLRYDDANVVDAVVAYLRASMRAWIDMGVAGFRCINVARAPTGVWSRLIAENRADAAVKFLAWTPGCTVDELAALAGCGFDATFSSAAWWDYRSPWLADEQERLNRIAPPIAFPDSPDDAVLARAGGYDEALTRRLLFRRALRLAAATGNGMLMPMGFEFGLSDGALLAGGRANADWLQENAVFDLSDEIRQANDFIASVAATFYAGPLRVLSRTDSGTSVLLRQAADQHGAAQDKPRDALLIVANASAARACTVEESQLLERAEGYVRHERIWSGAHPESGMRHALELAPADLQLFTARRLPPISMPAVEDTPTVAAAARASRIAIEAIAPAVDGGKFPVKRVIGDSAQIEADVFTDGHDKLAVALLWRTADENEWRELRMHHLENDRWCASLPLTRVGRYLFAVEAWRDTFATYRDELEKKPAAGLNVSLELEEGRSLIHAAARYADRREIPAAAALKGLAKMLKGAATRGSKAVQTITVSDSERIAALLSEPTAEAMRQADARPFAVRSEPFFRIDVERSAARFSSWYELFPRSQSGDPHRHGTFDDVIKRLPAIRAMGFDTLYFTPIHPIGRKHRKGRNNSLTAEPDDPGSPYAIGGEEGGHDAVHPQLGTLQDFQRLRDEAAQHGLELALDFAIQCSPDHPWLKEHPEWFAWRPDGSILNAENPPKNYQDIVNGDFYAKGALPGLWTALRDVVLFWVQQGVRVFRVDNPHTKPLPFWEWMINDIRSRNPDTIFLSEAFTRPKMMYRLAKVGFSQSYTYFTWRHTKQEFTEYMTELTTTGVREYFRPHFFVNTPDINPYFLQRSGRPGFLIRAALATTLSGLWGMYSGFELCEGTPIPG